MTECSQDTVTKKWFEVRQCQGEEQKITMAKALVPGIFMTRFCLDAMLLKLFRAGQVIVSARLSTGRVLHG